MCILLLSFYLFEVLSFLYWMQRDNAASINYKCETGVTSESLLLPCVYVFNSHLDLAKANGHCGSTGEAFYYRERDEVQQETCRRRAKP